jgi:hypothetical protein
MLAIAIAIALAIALALIVPSTVRSPGPCIGFAVPSP